MCQSLSKGFGQLVPILTVRQFQKDAADLMEPAHNYEWIFR